MGKASGTGNPPSATKLTRACSQSGLNAHYVAHTHNRTEWEHIASAVVFHALRRARPEQVCEACYTASHTQACAVCIHFYATIAPTGLAVRGSLEAGGVVELLVDETIVAALTTMLTQLPVEAQGGVAMLAIPLQPVALQA